jgi:hypothetical protein
MTAESHTTEKEAATPRGEPSTATADDKAHQGTSRRSVDTWILGLRLRALHLARTHGPDTEPGQYAIGVTVACRHAAQDRYSITPQYRKQEFETAQAESGYEHASALIFTALEQGLPRGTYDELLRGFAPLCTSDGNLRSAGGDPHSM